MSGKPRVVINYELHNSIAGMEILGKLADFFKSKGYEEFHYEQIIHSVNSLNELENNFVGMFNFIKHYDKNLAKIDLKNESPEGLRQKIHHTLQNIKTNEGYLTELKILELLVNFMKAKYAFKQYENNGFIIKHNDYNTFKNPVIALTQELTILKTAKLRIPYRNNIFAHNILKSINKGKNVILTVGAEHKEVASILRSHGVDVFEIYCHDEHLLSTMPPDIQDATISLIQPTFNQLLKNAGSYQRIINENTDLSSIADKIKTHYEAFEQKCSTSQPETTNCKLNTGTKLEINYRYIVAYLAICSLAILKSGLSYASLAFAILFVNTAMNCRTLYKEIDNVDAKIARFAVDDQLKEQSPILSKLKYVNDCAGIGFVASYK